MTPDTSINNRDNGPLILDFASIGNLLVPNQSNLQIPLPECATLQLFYRARDDASRDVFDLYAYVSFGAKECRIVNTSISNERSLDFKVQLRRAQLQIVHRENIKIRPSSPFGMNGAAKKVNITRTAEVGLGKGSGTTMGGEINLSSAEADGKGAMKYAKNASRTKSTGFKAVAQSVTTDHLVRYLPAGNDVHAWDLIPELILSGSKKHPTYQVLKGTYLSGEDRLLQFQRTPNTAPTLLLGIRTSVSDMVFDFDTERAWPWSNALSLGSRDKRTVAQELLREYIRKSIGFSHQSEDDLFIAIAAASNDDIL